MRRASWLKLPKSIGPTAVRGGAHFSAVILVCAVLLEAGSAAAYCRSRTCDPKTTTCKTDDSIPPCITEGHLLFRRSSCTSYAVQEDGSAKHGIDAEHFDALVRSAFNRWLLVDCGEGRRPSLEVLALGKVACDEVGVNYDSGNVSLFVFREDWEELGEANAYALTTVHVDPSTGEIQDTDVEINGKHALVTSSPADGVDLESILTHEVGHFLGLNHAAPTTVMRPYYTPGTDDLRILSADDVAGICAIYPPARKAETQECTPLHGFAPACRFEPLTGSGGGCAFSARKRSVLGALAGLLMLLTLGFARRSRE